MHDQSLREAIRNDDYQELLVVVDHREDEGVIVEEISHHLDEAHVLLPIPKGDELWVEYRGVVHHIPLTQTRLDRYVTISSVASIIGSDYAVLIEAETTGDDTHGLLVVRNSVLAMLEPGERGVLDGRFSALEVGTDYFSGIRIPYAGNEANNPDWAAELEQQQARTKQFTDQVMHGPEVQQALHEMRQDISAAERRLARNVAWRNRLSVVVVLIVLMLIVMRVVRDVG
jgi:hypothetical protein